MAYTLLVSFCAMPALTFEYLYISYNLDGTLYQVEADIELNTATNLINYLELCFTAACDYSSEPVCINLVVSSSSSSSSRYKFNYITINEISNMLVTSIIFYHNKN